MKKIIRDNYILIETDRESITDFTSGLTKNYDQVKNKNVVVNISEYKELELEELLGFLEISNLHRSHKRSFIIVNSAINIDKIPDELMVIPSLREAEDVIQMEEIERELGF